MARFEAVEGRCLGALPAGPARAGEADLSPLGGNDRAAWYAAACDRAGLDPAERPFAVRRVAGREALVAVGGAAERMAASRNLALATVEGPVATVVGGAVLVKVVCRATAPDGRAEVATATVPWAHPTRSEALCVARARARATLSLLGIAALDESDLAAFVADEVMGFNGAPARARRVS
ncbi:MAG: hypothetical protein U0324_12135 [Polyangiales bacterium]